MVQNLEDDVLSVMLHLASCKHSHKMTDQIKSTFNITDYSLVSLEDLAIKKIAHASSQQI